MVLVATPPDIYPLATAKGESIPLAVARPKGNVHVNLPKDAVLPLVLPDELNLVTCFFDKDIDLWIVDPAGATLVDNTYQTGLMALVGGVAYDLALPKVIWLAAHHHATIGQVNILERWIQLQNSGNYEVS